MYECVYINLPSCRHIVDVKQNNSFYLFFMTHLAAQYLIAMKGFF